MQLDMFAPPAPPAPARSTDRRPVLLGMNNPVSSNPDHALYPHPPGCAGYNLQQMSGLSRSEYLRLFDRQNLISGRAWNEAEARAARPELRERLAGRTVVLLGSPVNSAMRAGTDHELAPIFVWRPDGHGGWMAKVPHPSGLNRQYNQPLVRECLAIFMQELAALATEAVVG